MNQTKEDILEIDTLGFYLDRALNVLIKRLNALFKERGIDLQHAQFVILKALWVKNGMSQNELARLLGKNPAAISRAISYLETKGYVERKPINGSTMGVYLTDMAIDIRPQIDAVADDVTELGLQGISPAERALCIELLTSIYNSAK